MTPDTRPDPVEHAALDGFRSGAARRARGGPDASSWIDFGLRSLLGACQRLRAQSAGFAARVAHKTDGSPMTLLEVEIEEAVRANLAAFEPAASFVGEELGGAMPASGWAVAMDPIDGTWGFLNETSTWGSTLAVFRDGLAFAGFVANPATGEIAYAVDGGAARYLRVAAFGEGDFATTLGARPARPRAALVNLHPARTAAEVQVALLRAWERGELGALRSPGGSPAWSLVEAARGHYVYVNLWSQRPARPYDLAAAVVLVRAAGGDVTDLDGVPIDAEQPAGPWIASLDADCRKRVAVLVKAAWRG